MSSTKHHQRSCFRNGSFGKEEANISHHLLLKLGLQRGKEKKGGAFCFPPSFLLGAFWFKYCLGGAFVIAHFLHWWCDSGRYQVLIN